MITNLNAALIQYSVYFVVFVLLLIFYYRYGKYARGRIRDSIFIANGVTAIIFLVITLWILPEFASIVLPYPDPATFASILIAAIDYGNLLQGQKIDEEVKNTKSKRKEAKKRKEHEN